ncbi:type II toxin-antitoxin system antitoxin SocA domain-containing protein [Streptococcus sp.]|uniref:Panacea domain-containing protein n=1 Tax=Streptococcus sp. TaxID=1306 RepID=UPI000EEA9C61|nr:type II toxin-antitoxin system antitoxin SocA domain-containing protein [Streptococcus sp.]MCO4465669.1 hypothetical protein [Streptococcus infantarius subsp. infantarius]MCO4545307.1 hypothetical protein [Streptococcus infantarius subsp. infantarius]MCO4641786.1 hypothetical protein [Streptococcus infantarius subsp. infantarius]MCO4644476.1 hypothetical protein [Streptococcus infantarius subsp. infantarius]HAK38656.1 hypothetical protein [Streptococcus sp.]
MSMEKLANHIIAVAQGKNLSITNLQLQKVMYFTIRLARLEKSENDDELKKLYDKKFYVWKYGPVVPEIYDKYKKFGSNPITGNFSQDDEYIKWNANIENLLSISVFKLVNLSHNVEFWQKNSDKIEGYRSDVAYELENI